MSKKNGGERGIRTLERENPLTIFETVAFGHSAISPLYKKQGCFFVLP